jgi:hypothetical protein
VKLEHTYYAAEFIKLIARRSLGLAKSWTAQNLVNPRPYIMNSLHRLAQGCMFGVGMYGLPRIS